MNVGIFHIPKPDGDPAVIARRVEELGFESYWMGDHTIIPAETGTPYPGAPHSDMPEYVYKVPDPLIGLTRASAATATLKLGTGVCLVAERSPLVTAAQVGTLDRMCGGRLLFGVGGGWSPEECTILGGDFEHRWSQIREHVAAMKACWTEDPSEYHGKYVDFPPVRCFPKPRQAPHPPVLLGSIGNARSYDRVVAWGDGWMPIVQSVEEFAAGREEIVQRARAAGRDPDELDFTAFGLHGQWRTAGEHRAFAEAGCERLIVFLGYEDDDATLAELDELAGELLTVAR